MITEAASPMPTVEPPRIPKGRGPRQRRLPGDGPTAKQLVLEAVQELHSQGLPSTREAIARVTRLKLVSVDESLKALKEIDLVWAPERGVYRPIVAHPPSRAISKTILPSGLVKLEIGDDVLTLTPQENRMLAELQAGAAAQVASLEGANAVLELAYQANRLIQSEIMRQRAGQVGEAEEVPHEQVG